ncbi:M48 family metallopeptidase [Nodosilinea nodulosa]|uniref:M48 family metallopeptidase n=1 Tax=Nodosilinea nodulosa TaxID=416001 RepID=UPI0005944E2D|nr:M48 family metallopeptidase [Nodosilinea nodulosa]
MLSPLTSLKQNSFLRRGLYGLLAAVMAVTIGLATPTPSQAGIFDLIFQGIRYVQLGNLSDQDEVNLGSQIDQQLKAQGVKVYNRNSSINAYINEVGQRLAANSDRPNIPYTFQVVEDDSINAFATAGGYVYIQSGLIKAASNEAELAGVMAHEIGHIGGRHAINQMRQTALASGVAGALEVSQDTLVNLGVQLALQLPNSREAEYDADRRGFNTLGRAGYDPRGFITFMQKLEGGSTAEFLSTHPNPGNRVSNLQRMNSEGLYPNNGVGTDANAYKNHIRGL